MATTLNGRLDKLEAKVADARGPDRCGRCGLRHVQPLTMALIRGVLRVEGGSGAAMGRPAPLCLCDPCCTGDRWLARLSHGLPPDEDAA